MTEIVRKILAEALGAMGIPVPERIEVEVPRDEALGDLSTPIAMSLSRQLRKPPKKIAQEIIANIRERGDFEKIEVAGPGFINFTLKKDSLYRSLSGFLREGDGLLSRKDIGKGRKILLEFVSANPTGPLHLGHGRGAALGAALANLLSAAGFSVIKEYYINDAGRQVGLLGESVFAKYQELLGRSYPFPEDGYKGAYVEDIAKKIVMDETDRYKGLEFAPPQSDFFREYSCGQMLALIKADLEAFGVTFDTWQSEKELYDRKPDEPESEVEKTIRYLREKGYTKTEEGATWFKATEFGDEKDRVIIRSGGAYTYFASDIAYHKKKVDGGYDELINIWGADHHGYIPRVKAALEALGYEKERLKVLLVQLVSLLRGGKPVQMSKRAGEFITLKDVMEEVGADTTKFMFLTRKADSHLDFDLEVAKAASAENPVYYVQYAYARINSIQRHAAEKGFIEPQAGTGAVDVDLSPLSEPEEQRLIKKILLYPAVFEAAVYAREPHRITFYLQELAGIFHPYYNKHRIVAEDNRLTLARLALSRAARIVLRDGLHVLGVAAPERM